MGDLTGALNRDETPPPRARCIYLGAVEMILSALAHSLQSARECERSVFVAAAQVVAEAASARVCAQKRGEIAAHRAGQVAQHIELVLHAPLPPGGAAAILMKRERGGFNQRGNDERGGNEHMMEGGGSFSRGAEERPLYTSRSKGGGG